MEAARDILALGRRRRLVGLAALTLVQAALELAGALTLVPLLAAIDPAAIAGAGRWAETVRAVSQYGIGALLALFVSFVAARAGVQHWRAIVALEAEIAVVDGLRARAIDALLAADWRSLSGLRKSGIRALLVNSVDRVGFALHSLFNALSVAVNLAMLLAGALLLSAPVALVAVSAGGAVLFAYRGARRQARRLGERHNRAYDHIHAELEDSLAGLRVIKSFGREEEARSGLAGSFSQLRRTQLALTRMTGRGRIVLHTGGAIGIALLALWADSAAGLPSALLLPLLAILARSVPLLGQLQESWQHLLEAWPAWRETHTLLGRLMREDAREAAPAPLRMQSRIELVDVGLAHEADRPALAGVSLTLERGETVALVGPSGAGKSTLADVIGGLAQPDSGAVLIDGRALDGAGRRGWRQRVAYVEQAPVLVGSSVRANLLWGDPGADDDVLWNALENAGAAQFVAALPHGLDTALGETARALSGGERQRLALARALLRQPDLLILDEATSALDPDSERAVVAALAGLKGRFAMLTIAHRGRLPELADRTLSMANGRLVR